MAFAALDDKQSAALAPVEAASDTRRRAELSRHLADTRLYFLKGTRSGIQTAHAAKLARQLQRLDVARRPQDMDVPGWRLHPLKGDQKGHWSVWVSGNWRLTFKFEGEDAVLVDYQDYH